jgi:hypothetical protein
VTQDQARLLESAQAGSHVATAALIDALFARIEGLEFQVRRLQSEQTPRATLARLDGAVRRRLALPVTP